MKYIMALFGAIASANAQSVPDEWQGFVLSHAEKIDFLTYTAREGKSYASEAEFQKRAFQWHEADQLIKGSRKGFTMRHNKFSDWTQDEKDAMLSLKKQSKYSFDKGQFHEGRTVTMWGDDDDDELEQSLMDYYDDLADDGSLESADCEEGYFYHRRWKRCRKCGSGCKTCTSRRQCDECESEDMEAVRGKCVCPEGPLVDGMCQVGCEEGYYFHEWSGRCRRCGWNCTSCDKWYECDSCGNGFVPRRGFCYCPSGEYGPNFECLNDQCDDDQYRANDECHECPQNCASCEDETGECTECKDGYTAQNEDGCGCWDGAHDNGYGCVTCEDGEFFNGIGCSPCMENCDMCYDDMTCEMCAESYTPDENGWCHCPTGYVVEGVCTDVPECADGEYFDGQVCSMCGEYCSECDSFSGDCTVCSVDMMVADGQDCACPATMYQDAGECMEWTSCSDFERVTEDNDCVPCGDNCNVCADLTGECTECAEGFNVNSAGACQEQSDDCTNYGLVDEPAGCWDAPYSEDRLLPPYEADAQLVDWRDWGVVNTIRDQSTCGSCWAFMSTGAVESKYAIQYGPLLQASEQHLVSCDPYNLGCQGGWPTDAFRFWQEDGGPIQADAYPYTNDEAACYTEDLSSDVRIFEMQAEGNAYVNTQGYDMEQFKADLRDQPLAVAFGVANEFMYYFSGVYTGECEAGVNHGMVAIGYGYDETAETDYAIVRNSWGVNWGEDGYIRVAMSAAEDADGGKCMMYAYPNYPLVA